LAINDSYKSVFFKQAEFKQKTFITSQFPIFEEKIKMLKRTMKNDNKGIGGFFFDLPVLLLIIVFITVFTTSLYQVYLPIQEERERIEQNRVCIDLKNSVLNYPEILTEDNGRFSIEKIETLEEERLESHLGLEEDYNYNILFQVLESDESWSYGHELPHEEKLEVGVSSYQIPVSLVDEGGSSSLGRLRVSVWTG